MNPGRPDVLNECSGQIIPSLILLFDGLKRAYVAKAQEQAEEEESEEEDDDIEGTPGSKYWKFKKILFTARDSRLLLLLTYYQFKLLYINKNEY